jgi:hypothetical protein
VWQKADFTLFFIYSLVRSNPSRYLLLPSLVSGHHLDTFALSYCWISYRCLASSFHRTSFPFHFFSLIFIDLIYRLQRFSVFSFHLTVEFFLFSFLSLVGFDLSLSSFRSRKEPNMFFLLFLFFFFSCILLLKCHFCSSWYCSRTQWRHRWHWTRT